MLLKEVGLTKLQTIALNGYVILLLYYVSVLERKLTNIKAT
jgi:hypothetical protein